MCLRSLGHISDKVFCETHLLIDGITERDVEATKHCEECALRKSKRVPRNVSTREELMAVRPLESVFSDIVVPMKYESVVKVK